MNFVTTTPDTLSTTLVTLYHNELFKRKHSFEHFVLISYIKQAEKELQKTYYPALPGSDHLSLSWSLSLKICVLMMNVKLYIIYIYLVFIGIIFNSLVSLSYEIFLSSY